MAIDYVFLDDDGNPIGGISYYDHYPAGDKPVFIRLDDQSRQKDPVVWTNSYSAYTSTVMPLNRVPVFVSGLPRRSAGGGHAQERIRRRSKAATTPRRLRARGTSPTSARSSSTCPDGHYWSWSKKRCVKSRFP